MTHDSISSIPTTPKNYFCGTVRFLPDDNSIFATQECSEMKMMNNAKRSLYGYPIYITSFVHMNIDDLPGKKRMFCDDYYSANAGKLSGKWWYYLR